MSLVDCKLFSYHPILEISSVSDRFNGRITFFLDESQLVLIFRNLLVREISYLFLFLGLSKFQIGKMVNVPAYFYTVLISAYAGNLSG